MPVIIGNRSTVKNISETMPVVKKTIGIMLPMTIRGVGFNMSSDYIDQLKSNIKSLLLTQKGERVMQPMLGSDLYSVLFEQGDSIFESRIENAIESTLGMWLPFVSVDSITVTNNASSQNKFTVSIDFRVGGSPNLNSVDIEL